MDSVKRSNQMTFSQRQQLWDWIRAAAESGAFAARPRYEAVAANAAAALAIPVTECNVRRIAKQQGIAWKEKVKRKPRAPKPKEGDRVERLERWCRLLADALTHAVVALNMDGKADVSAFDLGQIMGEVKAVEAEPLLPTFEEIEEEMRLEASTHA